jgi:hypothetical protein
MSEDVAARLMAAVAAQIEETSQPTDWTQISW